MKVIVGLLCCILCVEMAGCAVVSVASAAVSVAGTAVGVAADAVSMTKDVAVTATKGAVKVGSWAAERSMKDSAKSVTPAVIEPSGEVLLAPAQP